MLLPQSDAKFKYCPLLMTHDDKMKFCLGAKCMFWRFAAPEKSGEDDPGFYGLTGTATFAAAPAPRPKGA